MLSTEMLVPSAEVQTPTIQQTRRYLRSIGAIPLPGGKGDHELWRLPSGIIIQLNPDKRDKKVIDLASLKAIAKAQQEKLNDARIRIFSA